MPDRGDQDDFARFAEMFEHGSPSRRQSVRPIAADDPQRRRRRKRGRIIALAIVGLVVASIAVYVPVTLTAPVGPASASMTAPTASAGAKAQLVMPPTGESAISVAGADAYLGASASGVLAASGGDSPLPMASISKLVTALVVLSAKPLSSATDPGPTLTFDKADHALYDKYYVLNATIAAMPTGSSMSEHDALEAMLVVSACNYAEAVSDWAFGSQTAFLSATRKWLASNGLSHTVMIESTGINARNVSTPSDLIALGKLAIANPAIAEIVGMKSLDIPFLQGMANTNDMLGTQGIDGIKTGTLGDTADLLFSAQLPVTGVAKPLTVVGVVLGGAGHDSLDLDVEHLLTSLTAGFHEVDVATSEQPLGSYTTRWGSSAKVVLGSSAQLATWSDTPVTVKLVSTGLKTGKSGEQVGTVRYTAGPASVTVPVLLQGSIAPPTAWWRLTHPQLLGR